MNYVGPGATPVSYSFGEGEGDIFLSLWFCTGTETNLMDCLNLSYGTASFVFHCLFAIRHPGVKCPG